jgi:hypothetical protein
MIGFFALTDTSIHPAYKVLSEEFQVSILTPETVLDDTQVLLVPSVGRFLAVADTLLDWNGVVIIFDCPVRCDSLVGITLLDVKTRTESFRYVFSRPSPSDVKTAVRSALEGEDEVIFHSRQSNMLPYLLNRTSCSQMDRVQTWKYSIKNTEVREKALEKLVSWFFNGKPTLEDLRNKLSDLVGAKPTALENLFVNNRFEDLRRAVLSVHTQKQAGKSPSVDKEAEKCKVSAFDVRYLMQAYAKKGINDDLEPAPLLEEIHKAARKGQKVLADADDGTD